MSTRIPAPRRLAQEELPRPRKEPRQARSRAMVEAIVQAGARVLGDRGWAGFTTNEVADVAGVSIGSLYQYFPDKLSLVEAIQRRHLDEVLSVMRAMGEGGKPLEQLAEDLVQGMVDAHMIQPTLHRVLLDDAPRHDGSRSLYNLFETEYLERYKALVAVSQAGLASDDLDAMAQVLSSAVEGVIHNASRRGTLTSPSLKQELVRLICAYLSNGDKRPSCMLETTHDSKMLDPSGS